MFSFLKTADMICWKLVNIFLIINLDQVTVSVPNIVILNNKPVKFNRRSDFADIITVLDPQDPVASQIVYKKQSPQEERSNLAKNTNFVTKSNFRGNLITKHNFTSHLPSDFVVSSDYLTKIPARNYSVATTTTQRPILLKPEIIIFNSDDRMMPGLRNTTKRPNVIKKPTIIVQRTTTEAPVIVTSTDKSEIFEPEDAVGMASHLVSHLDASVIHEHLMKNLEYYRKILNINCPSIEHKNGTKEIFYESNDDFVYVEAKPTKSKQKVKGKDKDKDKVSF